MITQENTHAQATLDAHTEFKYINNPNSIYFLTITRKSHF